MIFRRILLPLLWGSLAPETIFLTITRPSRLFCDKLMQLKHFRGSAYIHETPSP